MTYKTKFKQKEKIDVVNNIKFALWFVYFTFHVHHNVDTTIIQYRTCPSVIYHVILMPLFLIKRPWFRVIHTVIYYVCMLNIYML